MERIVIVFFSVIFFVFGATCSSSAQNKKEQIFFLQSKIDSLVQVNDRLKQVQEDLIFSADSLNRVLNLNQEKLLKSEGSNNVLIDKILSDSIKYKLEFLGLKRDLNLDQTIIANQRDSIIDLKNAHIGKNLFEPLDLDLEYSERSFSSDLVTFDGVENSFDGELNGLFTSYYGKDVSEIYSNSDRQIYATGNFEKGFKEGQWCYYNCDGSIAIRGEYKNGSREGKWRCLNHCFTKLGFLDLGVLWDYYDLGLQAITDYPIYVQSINFTMGVPSDTIFIENTKGQVVFIVIKKESSLVFLYENKSPFSDQSLLIDEDGFLTGFEDSSKLKIFQRDGSVKYLLDGNEYNCEELQYQVNGKLASKCIVINGKGLYYMYDTNGDLVESFEGGIHEGKWGVDCLCQ
jgi:antitoxin component YwqK of YwqJK toxin-antitoxin module